MAWAPPRRMAAPSRWPPCWCRTSGRRSGIRPRSRRPHLLRLTISVDSLLSPQEQVIIEARITNFGIFRLSLREVKLELQVLGMRISRVKTLIETSLVKTEVKYYSSWDNMTSTVRTVALSAAAWRRRFAVGGVCELIGGGNDRAAIQLLNGHL